MIVRKLDATYWILGILKVLCWLVLPAVLLICKFATVCDTETGSKLTINACTYIGLFFVFILAKKLLLKNFLVSLNGRIINYETILGTETDQAKLETTQKGLGKMYAIRNIMNCVPVIIMLLLLAELFKAIQNGLITLYVLCMWSVIFYFIGLVFAILQDKSIKSKNYITTAEISSTVEPMASQPKKIKKSKSDDIGW